MSPRLIRHIVSASLLAGVAISLPFALQGASARTFGAEPFAISSGTHAPSGSPAISGDNRVVRYVAFHSYANNLVPGDTNGDLDVFVYNRFTKGITRASVSSSGRQANGPSANPALDGSVQHASHCVAFQSEATNLAPGDSDPDWDIYVHDLRTGTTRLVSRGIAAAAVDPAISGDCKQIAFTAAGRIYVGNGLGRPRYIARGTNPDLSLDGSALTWERCHGVYLRRLGHTTRVAKIGGNPQVSDGGASQTWGVVFDTPARLTGGDHNNGFDVYLRTFKRTGGAQRTQLISGRKGQSLDGDSHNGGITAYAPVRGIIVFTNTNGGESTLYYMNLHTGNIDDLAHASATATQPGIFDVVTSARANYVAFSSTADYQGDSNGTEDVFLKFLSGQ